MALEQVSEIELPPHGKAGGFKRNHHRVLHGFTDHVSASPYRSDQIIGPGHREFFPQLADEDIDDLHLRLVQAAIEVAQKHFLS